MNRAEVLNFIEAAASLAPLPIDATAEHESSAEASTCWLEDVFWRERLNDFATVQLTRYANSGLGCGCDDPNCARAPYLSYDVEVRLGPSESVLSMTPESALAVAQALTIAGTAAMRDLVNNAGFLSRKSA